MSAKRIYVIIAFICCLTTAMGQTKVSINAIPQFNEAFGIRVGADIELPLKSRWSFLPGVYWSMRNRSSTSSFEGWDFESADFDKTYDYTDRAHFLTIPLRMSVLVAGKRDTNFNMKIYFGPYIAYGMTGTSKCDINNDGIISTTRVGAFDSTGRYKDRWDFGNNLGVEFLLKKHLKLGLMCEFGLRKIYKEDDIVGDIIGEIFLVNKINLAFGIGVGYQF